ncbi:two-component regulator propeller domain-containing protein [Sediminitomix flava]|uniref:Ligand-binding sensor domain-containing protein n=1 Tax=Sediminitomix flava TaxID=379075 RepID=A0A315YZJ3_SEDFL|nr:two-component regulator propeller domain-containing protein [Sediminitomix flava]PWJ35005.1 ligand-binding sensor domain-containing protein [Sediminitomix flava]
MYQLLFYLNEKDGTKGMLLPFLLSIFCFHQTSVFSQHQSLNLKSIAASEGLSQSDVYAVCQDATGFMWIGTDDGLNRYDGYEFSIYKNNPSDSSSLSFNAVRVIYEDSEQQLWIGTHAGLNLYNRQNDNFKVYGLDDGLTNIDVRAIKEDSTGNLWIGTAGGGLFFKPKDSLSFSPAIYEALSDKQITSLEIDAKGQLWIATTDGLWFLNAEKNYQLQHVLSDLEIRSLQIDQYHNLWLGTYGKGLWCVHTHQNNFPITKIERNLSSKEILNLELAHDGNLWIGTEGGGLQILNTKSKQLISTTFQTEDDISAQTIISLYADTDRNIWIGIYSYGLKFFSPNIPFLHYQHLPYNTNSISDNKITAFFEDQNHDWWIGTDGGGLNKYNPELGLFSCFRHQFQNENSLSSNHVISIDQDSSGYIWVGAYKGGLNRFDPLKNEIKRIKSKSEIKIENQHIWSLLIAKDQRVWCATSNGVLVYDPKTEEVIQYNSLNGKLSHNDTRKVFQDIKGDIWVGTFNGLNKFIPERNEFEQFYLSEEKAMPAKGIISIFEDSKLNIWIGTFGAGLYKFDRSQHKIIPFELQDQLNNHVIYSIEEDQYQNLWISTNEGLSLYHFKEKYVEDFTEVDGLQDGKFQRSSSAKLQDGRLVFGGINGFNVINPKNMEREFNLKAPCFTSFSLFNKEINHYHHDSPLHSQLHVLDYIQLDADEKVFSVGFSALNYFQSSKVNYAYRLDGFDESWNYIGSKRNATYTNLPYGNYTLNVKASLDPNFAKSSPESTIVINVHPHFWETLQFQIAMLLFATLIIGVIYESRVKYLKKRANQLNDLVIDRTKDLELQQEEVLEQHRKLLDVEHENGELLQRQLEEKLLFKQKELTTHTLHTIHKNELLKKLRDTLTLIAKKPEEHSRKVLKTLIREIDESFELDKDWGKFFDLFSEVHADFIHALQSNYPQLTPSNQRLCYLYRMNLSSQEIAHTLGISLNSVKVARHRLRKKLSLNEGESLTEFLDDLG